ncbi:hypothetical protein F383_33569 [Gossypium arboreum]|uniref:Uncharacterized protein n=1 Tax=Gossypium arboreum TaxID=29729 RepID=A0A0B0N348_GOSAR|nr:hypothetical protein F383_33569 [Gossypium arboreum]
MCYRKDLARLGNPLISI